MPSLAAALIAVSCGGSSPTAPPPVPVPSPPPTPAPGPVAVFGADIACEAEARVTAGTCQQMETAELVVRLNPAVVVIPGDLQYELGAYNQFLRSFDPSWGRFKPIIRPVPGNHEYGTQNAQGYFDYFNGVGRQSGVAGERGRGWYSFDVGAWHLIGLNSNCARVGGCQVGSPQEQWLRADISSHRSDCTVAFWHHPRYSSARNGNHPEVGPLFQALYDGGVDLVVVGHDHVYERFAKVTPTGARDPARGVRQFIVGTAGYSLYEFRPSPLPASELRYNASFGVLKLELLPNGYDWQFGTIAGLVVDRGTDTCH